ncbi:alkaline phosphatase family protein [Salinigranum marinum]|uniref:alkaline phosphatase family protein n=1 Tax=Salinigranum marinum TaxID=1515595 RepID=UPI002989D4E5|nr:alkaline phosphatase family protein [Salinigranum marinum]
MTRPTVLLIGVDAACFEQLDPLVAAGELPTIEALVARGAASELRTTFPPWTPSAWPSVVTGVEPWRHGVYDFHSYDGPTRLVSAADVRVPFLWETLSAHGHSSIVVNVPVTHPLHAFDGSLVPGYLAPEGPTVLVDGVERTLAELGLDDYSVYGRDAGSRGERVAEYERLVDSRVAVAERLAAEHDWAFMMVQFQAPDSVFHTDGTDPEAVARVYRRVDAGVKRLVDLAGEDCDVLLVSDHGIQQYSRVLYLNAWLRDRGDLVTAVAATRHVWNEGEKHALREGDAGGDDRGRGTDRERATRRGRVAPRALAGLARVGFTPARAERLLARVGLDEVVARALPESVLLEVVDASAHVDTERSAAYCRSLSSLGIRCNVAGRDPGGVIPAAAFDAFRAALVDDLRALRAPDGSPVFEAVEDRHALVGAVANEASAPDVLLRPAGMRWKVSDVVRERVFGETDEFSHTWTGLVVAAGPSVTGEFAVESPSVVDIAPTVLRLFGIDPSGLDGRSLLADGDGVEPRADDGVERRFIGGAGTSDGVAATAGVSGDDGDEDDYDVVADRLKQMGYLD